MERVLSKKNAKSGKRNPPQFSRLMMPIKMLTMNEGLDGLKFDINLGLTPKFQLGGSWNFSNSPKQPPNFTLMAMYSPNMSPTNMGKMDFVNLKKDIAGKLEFNSQYFLSDTVSLHAEGYFPNETIEMSHISLELMKRWRDCHMSYKMGGGSHSISMMQGVTDALHAGFEAMWHPMEKRFVYNYGMKYNKREHTLLASYIPIAKKEQLLIGYIARPGKHI